MRSEYRFPFGASSTPRPPRPPTGAAAAFVLGVYPSAFHVRWTPPAWLGSAGSTVGALAVADEPTVFWDGSDPPEAQAYERWRSSVGFVDGDEPGAWGHVGPSGNGSSGRPVADRVLEPLQIRPAETWFTDAVDQFFIKRGAAKTRGQADVIRSIYDPFAAQVGLQPASLPIRPSPSALVRLASTEHRERLRSEFVAAAPAVVITLGEEARLVLQAIADSASGRPLDRLASARFDGAATGEYGEAGRVAVGEVSAPWHALVHPGQRATAWRQIHDAWVDRRRCEG